MVFTGRPISEGRVSSGAEVFLAVMWPQTSGRSFYTGRTKIATPLYAASQPFARHNYNVSLFKKQSYGNVRAPLLHQDHALGAMGP